MAAAADEKSAWFSTKRDDGWFTDIKPLPPGTDVSFLDDNDDDEDDDDADDVDVVDEGDEDNCVLFSTFKLIGSYFFCWWIDDDDEVDWPPMSPRAATAAAAAAAAAPFILLFTIDEAEVVVAAAAAALPPEDDDDIQLMVVLPFLSLTVTGASNGGGVSVMCFSFQCLFNDLRHLYVLPHIEQANFVMPSSITLR